MKLGYVKKDYRLVTIIVLAIALVLGINLAIIISANSAVAEDGDLTAPAVEKTVEQDKTDKGIQATDNAVEQNNSSNQQLAADNTNDNVNITIHNDSDDHSFVLVDGYPLSVASISISVPIGSAFKATDGGTVITFYTDATCQTSLGHTVKIYSKTEGYDCELTMLGKYYDGTQYKEAYTIFYEDEVCTVTSDTPNQPIYAKSYTSPDKTKEFKVTGKTVNLDGSNTPNVTKAFCYSHETFNPYIPKDAVYWLCGVGFSAGFEYILGFWDKDYQTHPEGFSVHVYSWVDDSSYKFQTMAVNGQYLLEWQEGTFNPKAFPEGVSQCSEFNVSSLFAKMTDVSFDINDKYDEYGHLYRNGVEIGYNFLPWSMQIPVGSTYTLDTTNKIIQFKCKYNNWEWYSDYLGYGASEGCALLKFRNETDGIDASSEEHTLTHASAFKAYFDEERSVTINTNGATVSEVPDGWTETSSGSGSYVKKYPKGTLFSTIQSEWAGKLTRQGYESFSWDPASGTVSDDTTINVKWLGAKHTLTVKYPLDETPEGVSPIANYIKTDARTGETYTITSPAKEGYKATKASITVTMGNADKEESVTYNIQSYKLTVKYDVDDKTVGAVVPGSHIENVKYMNTYSVTSPDVTGFKPNPQTVTGTMGAADKTVDVMYNVQSYKLTINYTLDETAQGVTPPASFVKEDAVYGHTYTVASPALEGYKPAQDSIDVKMGASDKTESVQYNIQSYKLTVNYDLDDKTVGAQVPETHVENVKYKDNYSVDSPDVTGFKPNPQTVTGTMGAADKTADVMYNVQSYKLTVNYTLDETAQGVTPPASFVKEDAVYGHTYTVASPVLEGYKPAKGSIDVKMGAGDKTESVQYNIQSYKLTVKYDLDDKTVGAQAPETHVENVKYKDTYSVDSPDVTGFKPNPQTVTGTMGAADKTVDVMYNVQAYKLTVNYTLDETAQGVTPPASYVKEDAVYGHTYTVASPALEGYKPAQDSIDVKMGASDKTESVQYNIQSYKLTVNYDLDDKTVGAQAPETHVENVKYKDTYSVDSPDVTGFKPNPQTVTGTMGAADKTVDVMYNVQSYKLTVNYTLDETAQGVTPPASFVKEDAVYGHTYTVASPALEGYKPAKDSIDVKMGAGDKTESVQYNIQSYKLTVKYDLDDKTVGAQVPETHVENVKYKDTYSVDSPDVTGFKPNPQTVTGTMGAADKTVDVMYNVQSYKLTVNYTLDETAQGVTPPASFVKEDAVYGHTYTVASPALEGYKPAQDSIDVKMGAGDKTESVQYNIQSYKLTIDYVCSESGETYPDLQHSETLKYKAAYSVESPVIEGRTPAQTTIAGTMGAVDKALTGDYVVDKFTVKFVADQAEGRAGEVSESSIVNVWYGTTVAVDENDETSLILTWPFNKGTQSVKAIEQGHGVFQGWSTTPEVIKSDITYIAKFAEGCWITGTAIDKVTGQRIANAYVYFTYSSPDWMKDKTIYTTTDANGEYSLRSILKGDPAQPQDTNSDMNVNDFANLISSNDYGYTTQGTFSYGADGYKPDGYKTLNGVVSDVSDPEWTTIILQECYGLITLEDSEGCNGYQYDFSNSLGQTQEGMYKNSIKFGVTATFEMRDCTSTWVIEDNDLRFDYADEKIEGKVTYDDYYSVLNIVPLAKDGYEFTGWEVVEATKDTSSSANKDQSGSIVEDGNYVFKANFKEIPVDPVVDPTGNGTVSSTGSTGDYTFLFIGMFTFAIVLSGSVLLLRKSKIS